MERPGMAALDGNARALLLHHAQPPSTHLYPYLYLSRVPEIGRAHV